MNDTSLVADNIWNLGYWGVTRIGNDGSRKGRETVSSLNPFLPLLCSETPLVCNFQWPGLLLLIFAGTHQLGAHTCQAVRWHVAWGLWGAYDTIQSRIFYCEDSGLNSISIICPSRPSGQATLAHIGTLPDTYIVYIVHSTYSYQRRYQTRVKCGNHLGADYWT